MGIENRDFRESSHYSRVGGWGYGAFPPACKYLIIANVVVFLLQIMITRPAQPGDLLEQYPEYEQWLKDHPDEELPVLPGSLPPESLVQSWFQLETNKVIRQGQIWRLLTSAFCHDRFGIWHIVINMLLLYWFGRGLESMYGTREFLLFYLTAAVVASLAYIALDLATQDFVPAIGASGAVMAVMMLYAVHFPRSIIYVYLIPIEIRWLILLYVIFDLHPVLLALSGNQSFTGIAHAAHLGGLAFGFLYWKWNLRLEPWLDRLWTPRSKGPATVPFRRPRTSEPTTAARREDERDVRVDAILQKIHDHGAGSLTEPERELLKAASQRYQRRRNISPES